MRDAAFIRPTILVPGGGGGSRSQRRRFRPAVGLALPTRTETVSRGQVMALGSYSLSDIAVTVVVSVIRYPLATAEDVLRSQKGVTNTNGVLREFP